MGTRAATRFTLVLVLTLSALVGVQVLGVHSQRAADQAADARIRLTGDVEQIRYYDELLTMSARLAAATGDESYVRRYQAAVPELDAVIEDAKIALPDAASWSALASTDQANQSLIELERQSFALLADGDREAAYATVNSDRYASLKTEYQSGMNLALERLQLVAATRQQDATRRQNLSLGLGAALAVLLAVLWTITAQGLSRSQRAHGRAEARLQEQANTDPLTGLANRRLFREGLAEALAAPQHRELAVLFADLDQFKTVNDTRGHADGDRLLVEVAERLIDLLNGHPGSMVARLGGDEFAVLLPAAGEGAVADFAHRLVASLRRPYAAAPEVPVTTSVGVAVADGGERDAGALLRAADLAMYEAKNSGRDQWSRYASHLHTELLARVELEGELRNGLQRGELVVHYQPIYHLSSGRLRSVEALVRWQHPRRGLLLPGAFIPLAETNDLILGLGRHVLHQACWQLASWTTERGAAAPDQVAVNVSPRELSQPGYAEEVLQVLQLTGLAPSRLVLEVTESTVMTSQPQVVQLLMRLRSAGVRVAIDDFGTGHSSLARLNQLPVDVVKIDRSFVVAAAPVDPTSPGDATMLEILVTLADRLQLDVVAEGIETTRQLEAVRNTGCAYGQGFLLARPHPDVPTPAADPVVPQQSLPKQGLPHRRAPQGAVAHRHTPRGTAP